MLKTDLSTYDNSWYKPGNTVKRILWYVCNRIFFNTSWSLSSSLKVVLLRLFGAKVGRGVVVKPNVNIKYPWNLSIGNHCWIGEKVWIDNLEMLTIESNVCISQGALLICGNHNYKKSSFDLIIQPICLKEGSWVGANATVAPGVTLESHAVLSMGSVATSNLDSYSIYQGNPAIKVKSREIV